MASIQATTAPSITLELTGDAITLPIFVDALSKLSDLLNAASTEVGASAIEWIIQDLAAGSAIATVVGTGAPDQLITDATAVVLGAAVALEERDPLLAGLPALEPIRSLTGILNGVVSDLTLISGQRQVTITSADAGRYFAEILERPAAEAVPLEVSSIGRIVGVVKTVSHGRGLTFEIRDERSGKLLKANIDEDLRDDLRAVWDERAVVVGKITRDTRTGRPKRLENVRSIDLAPTADGAFFQARGVLGGRAHNEAPEVTIRRLRDAS